MGIEFRKHNTKELHKFTFNSHSIFGEQKLDMSALCGLGSRTNQNEESYRSKSKMVLQLDGHPRWNPTGDRKNQSKILPGTEDGERIRINAAINVPENFESVEDVLICQAEGTDHTIYSLWKEACEKYGGNNCLGDRRHGGVEF